MFYAKAEDMENKNICCVSFFMPNIPSEVVVAQKSVVEKFLPTGITFLQVCFHTDHASAIDNFLRICKYEIIILLDIDAIPLHSYSFAFLISYSLLGCLSGNIQRTNCVDNNRHVYVAPSVMSFSAETYNKLGCPSFKPTSRGDVGEELTYTAERYRVPLKFLRPSKVEGQKVWALDNDDSPQFGRYTSFGDGKRDLFFHAFEIRLPDARDFFIHKCMRILEG